MFCSGEHTLSDDPYRNDPWFNTWFVTHRKDYEIVPTSSGTDIHALPKQVLVSQENYYMLHAMRNYGKFTQMIIENGQPVWKDIAPEKLYGNIDKLPWRVHGGQEETAELIRFVRYGPKEIPEKIEEIIAPEQLLPEEKLQAGKYVLREPEDIEQGQLIPTIQTDNQSASGIQAAGFGINITALISIIIGFFMIRALTV